MKRALVLITSLNVLALGVGCEADTLDVFGARHASTPAAGGSAGSGGSTGTVIFDRGGGASVPEDAPELFAGEGEGVGPCLVEPELGALLPRDWLRPRFRFIPALGQTLFEIRLRSGSDYHVVVYTSSTSWTLPRAHWVELASTEAERLLTVSVRGVDATRSPPRPSLATTGSVTIAPVDAGGVIHYFTSTGGSALKTFAIDEEGTRDALRPEQTAGRCIGCHEVTPDPTLVASSVSSDPMGGDPAHIELTASDGSGRAPSFLTSQARALLSREQQHLPTFSGAHFQPGDRVMVSVLNGELIWTDLEATALDEGTGWGTLERVGDPNATVTHPDLNQAGTAIAYTSIGLPRTIAVADGTDVYVVPYGARKGGPAAPLAGASTPESNEFYPAFSPDDALVLFNKTTPPPAPVEPSFPFAPATSTYANPSSELYVVTAEGGVPQRLLANDPPACSGRVSPGVSNNWAKWSPRVTEVAGKRYYFLAFSSTRADAELNQLYATALTLGEGGQLISYPALYFWNQPATESNHQPVWSDAPHPSDASP